MIDIEEQTLIERVLRQWGFNVQEWWDSEDGVEAVVGRARVVDDDPDEGLFADDEGLLTAQVVGSVKYGNQRVAFQFTPDDYDGPSEVRNPENIELLP